MRIHKLLGCGFPEKIYIQALKRDFSKEKIKFDSEKVTEVIYDGEIIGKFKLDLVVDRKIIVEIKSAEKTLKIYREQLASYLKATNYNVGLLINFGTPKLEYFRFFRER